MKRYEKLSKHWGTDISPTGFSLPWMSGYHKGVPFLKLESADVVADDHPGG